MRREGVSSKARGGLGALGKDLSIGGGINFDGMHKKVSHTTSIEYKWNLNFTADTDTVI